MTTPDPFHGNPPPSGYGAQIQTQGGVETWRNLICHKCGALVPNDPWPVEKHNEWHRFNNEALDKLVDAVERLEKRFVIQEES